MKLLKLLRDKVRTDWIEFITYKREQWAIKRETRNLNRAINKAREWNLQDGKTYYILRAGDGQIYAMNRDTIKQFERMKMLPKMTMIKRLEKSMSIVTSNKGIQEQYTQIKLRMEKTTGKRGGREFTNYMDQIEKMTKE